MSNEDMVDALLRAIERNDMPAVSALYADDVRVWHNVDGVEQTKDESIAMLSSLKRLAHQHYVVEERIATGDRVAQRHRLVARTHGGVTHDLAVALFVTIRDGRIVRIDEYFDTATLAPLMVELEVAFGAQA